MQITKYGHACVVLKEADKTLVIDPGNYSNDLSIPDNVVAIVLTHAHGDHLNKDLVMQIKRTNPDATVYGPPEVATALEGAAVTVVKSGDTQAIEPFTLTFYGEKHADIVPGFPGTDNIGVLVNDRFYYAGDSFQLPDKPITVLAVPVSGPWLRIGDTATFIAAVKPQHCFPTHDAFLSDIGADGSNSFLSQAPGTTYHALKKGESIEV